MLKQSATFSLLDGDSSDEFKGTQTSTAEMAPVVISQIEEAPAAAAAEKECKVAAVSARIVSIEEEINRLNAEKEQSLLHLSQIASAAEADRVRNRSSTFVKRVSVDRQSTQILDVIAAMKRGTQFLKFGHRGKPKHHHFELTADHQHVRWFSKKKKSSKHKTAIKLESVCHLQKGHLYTDSLADARYHERAFSISYRDLKNNEERTLEVVARTKTDFQVWTKGLELIIKRIADAKKGHGAAYDVKRHFPAESFMEIHRRNQEHYERALRKKEDPQRESVERCLSLLLARFAAAEKLRDRAIRSRNSETFGDIDSIMATSDRLAEIKDEVEDIGSSLHGGNKKLSVLSRLIHDLAIEVAALEEKLDVLSHSTNQKQPSDRRKTYLFE